MAYSKRFPRDRKASPFANWEEVALSKEEETAVEQEHRETNIALMQECLADAKKLFAAQRLADAQSDVVATAIALFNQRSRHVVYHKEERAKEKFDRSSQ